MCVCVCVCVTARKMVDLYAAEHSDLVFMCMTLNAVFLVSSRNILHSLEHTVMIIQ